MNGQDSSPSLAVICTLPAPVDQKLSDTSSSPAVIIATPSVASEPDAISLNEGKMDSSQDSAATQAGDKTQADDEKQVSAAQSTKDETKVDAGARKKVHAKSKHASHKTKRKVDESPTASEASSSEDSESDEDSSSEDEKAKAKKKRVIKVIEVKKKGRDKKAKPKERVKDKKKSKKYDSTSEDESSSDSSDSESDSETEMEVKKSHRKVLRAKSKKKSKKVESSSSESSSGSSSSSSSSETSSEDEKAKKKKAKAKAKTKVKAKAKSKSKSKKAKKVESSDSSSESSSSDKETAAEPSLHPELVVTEGSLEAQLATVGALLQSLQAKQEAAVIEAATTAATTTSSSSTTSSTTSTKAEKPAKKKKKALEFKRVDQVFDLSIHDWKLVESNKDKTDNFDCVFTVRRRLNWEGKYVETRLDIKSKLLRNALQEVLKDCKSVSLVEDIPQLDPHTLFHYYDELKTFVRKTLKPRLAKAKRSKEKKRVKSQIDQCNLLLGYIDEDYTATRKALKPMLKAGTITYDLVWALFKPNTIAFTPTYGNKDDPRCFKVDGSYEYESWMTGIKSWYIDGKYLEYDGKSFGLGEHQVGIQSFKGHRKITSLAAYPLEFHKDAEGIRKQLIERGKKFVALEGMNYRLQKGIAYMKHKNTIVRFIINGRVMVDPAIFRRINPNYPLSYLRPDELGEDDEEGDGGCCDGEDDDEDEDDDDCGCDDDEEKEKKDKMRIVMWKDKKGRKHAIKVRQSVIDKEMGPPGDNQNSLSGDEDASEKQRQIFTEEELLIASPVVLGFAFSDKLWLEFSLSGIEEIKWNEEAFSSLVLPREVKQNLKGLVSSHRFHAAKTIDDVIQGKGKGLNVVLHGPPGVGKTLTGESIAEYLQCPLYAVSAGELGTNSRTLETDLNRIMDITHSWGAILLLDEADVFLEARQPHDIHRNSLVSVFLRLTEYYQGILFLTTNRVETFDEAFQSRIHMGIRYEHLPAKARRKIWQQHVGKVEKMRRQGETGNVHEMKPFSDADFDELSKRNMNGRQIKNTVKTSQAIALAEKAVFSMEHVRRVLEVAEAFEDDMKGGKGYRDAMRQYT